jgi:hypothetical protein
MAKRGRRPLNDTQAILDVIQEYWVERGPEAVLALTREIRPSMTMANLRNYYHQLARLGKVKDYVGYRKLSGWEPEELDELRRLAESGLTAGEIAKQLGVRRWAVLMACSAHGISVRR